MKSSKIMTSSGLQFYDGRKPERCDDGENILRLIPIRKTSEIAKRYTRHRSCHRDRIIAEKRKKLSAWKTMGHALEPLKDPDCYLKKGCGIKPPMHCVTKHCPRLDEYKACLPKEPPLMGQKRDADFIKINAAENILLKYCPNAIRRGFVDDKKGHFENLVGNNLEKKYVYKPCYGRTPKYLLRRYRQSFEADQSEDR